MATKKPKKPVKGKPAGKPAAKKALLQKKGGKKKAIPVKITFHALLEPDDGGDPEGGGTTGTK